MKCPKIQPDLKPPTGLSKPASALWAQVLRDFELEGHHVVLLEQACRALTRINQAEEQIRKEGLFIQDRFGTSKENPAVEVECKNRRLLKSFLRELQLDVEPADHGYDRAPRLVQGGRQLKRA